MIGVLTTSHGQSEQDSSSTEEVDLSPSAQIEWLDSTEDIR